MIGRHHPDSFPFGPLSPVPGDPDSGIQQVLRGGVSQQDDHLRPDQPGLHPQMDPAGIRFLWRRHPVVRRAAFDHIADINPVPGQLDCLQHPGQQLAGRADKGQPFLIFRLPRAFSDQHQGSIPVSLPGNLVQDMLMQRTQTAGLHLTFKQFPGDFFHEAFPPARSCFFRIPS